LHQTHRPKANAWPSNRLALLSINNALGVHSRANHQLCWSRMKSMDAVIVGFENALRTLAGVSHAGRPNPALGVVTAADTLSAPERKLSGALMRVNHVGEVCAQALYQAQALSARTPELRQQMQAAAREEADHLAWTQQRLDELSAHASWLNPVWYAGAFGIGLVAGRMGDPRSLGFVVETERQVEQHLAGHLDRLPLADAKSRAIVSAMQADESRHAQEASAAGAVELPLPARWLMRAAAKLMTATARYV
jgi:3-demethoxyubiquinol 3-hydroxylase